MNHLTFYATKAIMLAKKKIDECVFIGRDTDSTGGPKQFCAISIDYWVKNIDAILSVNDNLYEVIAKEFNAKLKLYFDLDYETNEERSNDPVKNQELVEVFLTFVSNQIYLLYGIEILLEDYIILDSSRQEKISFHVILQNKLCFTTIQILKGFIDYLLDVFEKQEEPFKKMMTFPKMVKDIMTRKCFLDRVVYKPGTQQYRLMGQSKKGKSNILQCADTSIFPKDTFIQLYEGGGSRYEIENTDNFAMELSLKNKPEAAYTRHKMLVTGFQFEGDTLLKKEKKTFVELRKEKEYLQYLYLIPNDNQPRDQFILVGFAIRGAGGKLEDFNKWAKLSGKYKEGRDVAIFYTFSTNQLGLEYLKQKAKLACPAFFDEGLIRLHDYFHPSYEGINVIEENGKYISSEVIKRKEDMILLNSTLGSGKTQIIKQLLAKGRGYKRVLGIMPRITFAHFFSKEFDMVLYLDENVDLTADKLAISMESLYKIDGQTYDFIIMDEVEALLSIFSSTTLRDRLKTFNILETLIKKAKRIVLAGAFITKKTILFMLYFKKSRVCIRNNFRPEEKIVEKVEDAKFLHRLLESIEMGEKNFVCYSSLTSLKEDVSILKGSISHPVLDAMEKSVIYSSESDGSTISDLKNMEGALGEKRLIMATPALTVGNSYNPEKPDVHNIFIRGKATCIVADTFQTHFRVRQTINKRLIYSLPTKKDLNIVKQINKSNFEVLKKYDEWIAKVEGVVRNTKYDACRLMKILDVDFSSGQPILDLMKNFETKEKTPKILRDIIFCNFEETTLSSTYYEQMFDIFLEKLNYKKEINNDQKIVLTEENKKIMNDMIENKKDEKIKYCDIEMIGYEEEMRIDDRQRHRLSTNVENQQLKKCYFMKMMGIQYDVDVYSFYFELYRTTYGKEQFMNAKYEMGCTLTDKVLTQDDNRPAQAVKIRELLTLLSLESSYEKKEISRKDIEKVIPHLEKYASDLKVLFKMGNVKDKKIGVKYEVADAATYIKSIFRTWNNCALVPILDSHKKVIAYNFHSNNAFMRDGVVITPFDKLEEHVIVDIGRSDRLLLKSEVDAEIQQDIQEKISKENQEESLIEAKKKQDEDSKRSQTNMESSTRKRKFAGMFHLELNEEK